MHKDVNADFIPNYAGVSIFIFAKTGYLPLSDALSSRVVHISFSSESLGISTIVRPRESARSFTPAMKKSSSSLDTSMKVACG